MDSKPFHIFRSVHYLLFIYLFTHFYNQRLHNEYEMMLKLRSHDVCVEALSIQPCALKHNSLHT